LQTQLASAKASFETETALLGVLRERHAAQTAEIQKVREELIRGESDLSAVRVEKAELEGSFLRDKEEVRDLNRGIVELTSQIATTRQEVEKVKKEAKQQKGLLAIARKQFATKESEKAKVDKELEEAQTDLTNVVEEREEVDADVPAVERAISPANSLAFAAAQPLPLTPDLTGTISPGGAKSNNPFDKLTKSADLSTPRSQSPLRSFSTVSIPIESPPVPHPIMTVDNPFGFMQAFEGERQQSPATAPDTDAAEGATTPRLHHTSADFNDAFATPISEHFATPNGGTPVTNQGSDPTRIPSLDVAASHFPALDDIPEQPSDRTDEQETDLSTNLQELEVQDSDSDNDSDQDTNEDATQNDAQAAVGAPSTELSLPSAPISFDAVFDPLDSGVASSSVPTTKSEARRPSTVPVDAFGAPLSKPAEFTTQSPLTSFDEAFGKPPTTGPSQPSSGFSFDTAFDDNFDFGPTAAVAATEATTTRTVESTLPSTVTPMNGNIQPDKTPAGHTNGLAEPSPQATTTLTGPKEIPPQQSGTSVSFESAFAGPWSTGPAAESEKTGANPPNQPGPPAGIAFGEAFGGLEASQALKLDNSFSSRSSKALTMAASPSPSDVGKPFPAISPPTSPRGPSSPRVTSGRSASPHRRAASPPPRVTSPKTQRSSTSSSRDVAHEKPAPPPRHSKISVSLAVAFGRPSCDSLLFLFSYGCHLERERNTNRLRHFPPQALLNKQHQLWNKTVRRVLKRMLNLSSNYPLWASVGTRPSQHWRHTTMTCRKL